MDFDTEERIASLEAQVQQLLMMQMMASGENNGMLGEVVEPIPIASGGGGGGNDKPFDYVTEKETQGGVEKDVYKIVRCSFHENGEEVDLSDYSLSAKPNGMVYLRGVRGKDDVYFTWDIGTTKIGAPSGGEAYNFKIYSFNDGNVECDYRDTFLNITTGAWWL